MSKIFVMTKRFTLILLCCIAFAFTSCHKFEGQSVPAYIHIDSITLSCDYATQKANTSNFTDAWVYIDDQITGCYELPATFPILKNGPHKVSIYGGICINGIGDTRSPYPFCAPKIYEQLNLVEDSIITLNPVVNYYPIGAGWNMSWNEDFESTCSLAPTAQSDTNIIRYGGDEAWHSFNSFYSGRVALPPDSLDFCIAGEEMNFHSNLADGYCMLEMDYNTNDTIFVGVMYYKNYQLVTHPLVKVLPTDKGHSFPQKWKKMYINLSRIIKDNVDASYFKVYFTSDLTVPDDYAQPEYHPISEQRYYLFDNLKVLWRP